MNLLQKVSKSSVIDGSLKVKDLFEFLGLKEIINFLMSIGVNLPLFVSKWFKIMNVDWISLIFSVLIVFIIAELISVIKLLRKQDREQKLCIYDLSLRLEYYKTIMQQNESQFNDIHRQTLKSIKQRIGENADEKLQMLGIKLENINEIAINLNMNKPRIENYVYFDNKNNIDSIIKTKQ